MTFFGGEEERLALDLAAAGWALCYAPQVVARHVPSTQRDVAARRVRIAAVRARHRLPPEVEAARRLLDAA